MRGSKSTALGLLGMYGNGNLGDEAIFVSFLQWLHQHAPNVGAISLCVNPAYIMQTYGVESYAVSFHHAAVQTATTGKAESSLKRQLRKVLVRFCPLLAQALRSSQRLLDKAWAVAGYFPTQLRIVRSLDGVIVLGGGQVVDFWTGPLGHPATLFSWALACRILHRPLIIASVGATSLRHGASRWFVRNAFRCSKWATVRDAESAAVLRSLGVRRSCAVVPDLAWGLNLAQLADRRSCREELPDCRRSAPPRVIGICPMAYRHPQHWPDGEVGAYCEYIGELASFCSRLLSEGHAVVLFPTQTRSDGVAVEDLAARLAPQVRDRVRLWPVDGIPELLRCLSYVDAVVTSRFHGLLLALLAGRPALSLSYQSKNDALLGELGEQRFALDIHTFSAETLWARFEKLRADFGAYSALIGPHLTRNRQLLDSQYREIFEALGLQPQSVVETDHEPAT